MTPEGTDIISKTGVRMAGVGTDEVGCEKGVR